MLNAARWESDYHIIVFCHHGVVGSANPAFVHIRLQIRIGYCTAFLHDGLKVAPVKLAKVGKQHGLRVQFLKWPPCWNHNLALINFVVIVLIRVVRGVDNIEA